MSRFAHARKEAVSGAMIVFAASGDGTAKKALMRGLLLECLPCLRASFWNSDGYHRARPRHEICCSLQSD